MAKVYIVTSGDYSDYSIDSVFSTREAAEKRCAVWRQEELWGDPRIEEYDLEDGSNVVVEQVYKAMVFDQRYVFYQDKISVDFRMMYDIKPFKEEINRKKGKTHSKNGKTIELYYGTLPVNKTVEKQAEAEKIIFDRLAKWKAEQMGL